MSMLHNPRVRTVLDRLLAESALPETEPPPLPAGFDIRTGSAQMRADALSAFYLPISEEAGKLLYALVRASRPETIVEFGTSYGISTIFLASAVADNRTGHV